MAKLKPIKLLPKGDQYTVPPNEPVLPREVSPDIDLNIPVAGDEIRTTRKIENKIDAEGILVSGDETRSIKRTEANISPEGIIDSKDINVVHRPRQSETVDLQIDAAGNESIVHRPRQSEPIDLEISVAPNEVITQRPRITGIDTEGILASQDEIREFKRIYNQISTELPVIAPDERRIAIPRKSEHIDTELTASDDDATERIEKLFTGRWLPDGDPIAIGSDNYSVLENLRYTDFGLEGVGGWGKANQAADVISNGSEPYIQNVIQLRTNFSKNSYIIAQDNTGANSQLLFDTDHAPGLPDDANFNWTQYGSPVALTAGESKLRMAILPRNHVGMFNGTKNFIWAGVEKKADAFLAEVANDCMTPLYDTFIDYTRECNTTGKTVTLLQSVGITWYHYLIGSTRKFSGLNIITTQANNQACIIGADNDVLMVYYNDSSGGAVATTITITTGTYTGTELAAAIQTAMTTTATPATIDGGTCTFTNGKIVLGCEAADRLHYVYAEDGNQAGWTLGFTADQLTPAVSLTASENLFRLEAKLYYNGTWSDLTLTDNTISSYVTLSDTTTTGKTVTWTYNTNMSQLFLGGYCRYWIMLAVTNGSATIESITTNNPPQELIDTWDGIYRFPLLCNAVRSVDGSAVKEKFNFTAEMQTRSPGNYGTGAVGTYTISLGYIQNIEGNLGCWIECVFKEKISALKFEFWNIPADTTNITKVEVYTNTGGGWSAAVATIIYDTTRTTLGTPATTFKKTGVIAFEPTTAEATTSIDGISGYAYKILITADGSGTLSDSHRIDLISGVTRGGVVDNKYIFPMQYRSRVLLCGSISDNEKNRIDYSMKYAPDVYNGKASSEYDNSQSLYFGDDKPLTCGIELFNVYGQDLNSAALIFKNNETYLLRGDNPDEFTIDIVSKNIGCPAPETLTVAEVALTDGERQQNVALWLSDKGPVIYYNNTIYYLPDMEPYFDTNDTTRLNPRNLHKAFAFFDSTYKEWNLLFPSGTTTTCNMWLVYDLRRKKWFKKVHPSGLYPTGSFMVEDAYGIKFNYLFSSDGYLRINEFGASPTVYVPFLEFDTEDIVHKVATCDFFLASSMWVETLIRRLQTLFKVNDEGALTVTYYKDRKTAAETVTQLPDGTLNNMAFNGYDVRHLISQLNLTAWTHKFQFQVDHATATKPRLIGYALWFQKLREVIADKNYQSYLVITTANDGLKFTKAAPGGTSTITVTAGSYTREGYCTALQTALNGDVTLTNGGTTSYTVTLVSGKITITSSNSTLAFTYLNSDGAPTAGFNDDIGAGSTITAQLPL